MEVTIPYRLKFLEPFVNRLSTLRSDTIAGPRAFSRTMTAIIIVMGCMISHNHRLRQRKDMHIVCGNNSVQLGADIYLRDFILLHLNRNTTADVPSCHAELQPMNEFGAFRSLAGMTVSWLVSFGYVMRIPELYLPYLFFEFFTMLSMLLYQRAMYTIYRTIDFDKFFWNGVQLFGDIIVLIFIELIFAVIHLTALIGVYNDFCDCVEELKKAAARTSFIRRVSSSSYLQQPTPDTSPRASVSPGTGRGGPRRRR